MGLGLCRLGLCHGGGHSCSIIAKSPSGAVVLVLGRRCRSLTDGLQQGFILLYS